jgi:hypothetical protein
MLWGISALQTGVPEKDPTSVSSLPVLQQTCSLFTRLWAVRVLNGGVNSRVIDVQTKHKT